MSKNKIVVPEAREAMDRFKMEAAAEVGVNLKQGYNGDLTSKQDVYKRQVYGSFAYQCIGQRQ